MNQNPPAQSEVIEQANGIKNLINTTTHKIKTRIFELNPENNEELGLVDTVEYSSIPRIGELMTISDELTANIPLESTKKLPATTNETLFEVVQVVNIVNADEINIDLYVKRTCSLKAYLAAIDLTNPER